MPRVFLWWEGVEVSRWSAITELCRQARVGFILEAACYTIFCPHFWNLEHANTWVSLRRCRWVRQYKIIWSACMDSISFQRPFSPCALLKVLLRRHFVFMFVTKNHLYELIKEDCSLKFHWNENFHPANWTKFSSEKLFIRVRHCEFKFRYKGAVTCFSVLSFLSWRHFLNSRWHITLSW